LGAIKAGKDLPVMNKLINLDKLCILHGENIQFIFSRFISVNKYCFLKSSRAKILLFEKQWMDCHFTRIYNKLHWLQVDKWHSDSKNKNLLFWLDKSQTSQHSFLSCLKQN
jgi:hypothetical protein